MLGDCVIVQAAAPITGVLSLFDARKAPQLYIPRRLGDPRNAACQVRHTGMAAVSRTCAFCLACVSLAFACTYNPAAAAIRLQAF